MTQTKRTVIFLHIPKTAGTTLHRIIDRQYKTAEDTFVINPRVFMEEPASVRQKGGMVRGHLWYGLHEYVSAPYTYMTILREPVKRVLSLYKHAYRDPHHNMHPKAKQYSLKEFYDRKIHKEAIDNSQVRMVSGVWDQVPFGACNADLLEQAKHNLVTDFSVIGTMDQFDESLMLMQEAFDWRYLYYTKHNTGGSSAKIVDEETYEHVKKHNEHDIALYRFAKELCQTEIVKRGQPFQEKLQRFRRINQRLNPIHRAYWQMRQISVRSLVKETLGL